MIKNSLSRHMIWKGVIALGCASIVMLFMQYDIIGRYHMTFSTLRHDHWLNFRGNEIARVVGIKDGNIYITRRNLHTNSSTNSDIYFNLNHLPPIEDDVFLEWNEDSKEKLAVFVLSAISRNTSLPGYKNVLKLNAWEGLKHRHYVFKCCVLWKNNKKSQVPRPHRTYWKVNILAATQYSCPIRGRASDVRGVAIEFNRKRCPSEESQYVKPFLPLRQKPKSFAICAKIVYGNIDYKLLIDWVEYYRELKVDKIIMFAYNISGTPLRVLHHYSKEGFLEIRRFDFPWKKGYLARDVGVKNSKAWQDEQVVVFDCFERLQGYSYIAIVDLDEFIFPKRQNNLKDAMTMLMKHYPTAAGFTFQSYLFIKDLGKTVVNNGSDIVQYYKRTPAVYTRYKNILIPPRVQSGSVCTHEFLPRPGYNRTIVPEHLAIVFHYRYCYDNYKEQCTKPHIVQDRSIDRIVNRTRARTYKLLQRFQGL